MIPIRHRALRTFRVLLVGLALALPGTALAQTADEIRDVQAWLNDMGYDAGPADGLMGGRTRSALEDWQIANGRVATGEVSADIVALARGGADAEADEDAGDIMIAVPDDDGVSPVSTLAGDPTEIAGQGPLDFTETDGGILITDGFPWRRSVTVESRTIEVVSTSLGLFSATPESDVPVPLDGQVVDVPGSSFVPLFLAFDPATAATGSLSDAVGVTWRFSEGDQRFELDGYVLSAADPGATIAFRDDGVLVTGFELQAE